MAAPPRKFEEYESDDEYSTRSSRFKTSSTPKEKSYDIIARNCGCPAGDLKKWAKIRRLKPSCRLYKHITTYAEKSSGGLNVTVQRIYKIDRKDGPKRFDEKFRMVLWHGTKASFVPGIIQSGFRLGTGGSYGGGIYFADRLALSAGFVQKTSGNVAYLFLSEVCLGKVYKAHHAHTNYTSAPPGFDTVKANGKEIPAWGKNRDYYGAIIPCGETKTNTRHSQYDYTHSEYILYDHNRVIVRFLVECTW